MKVTLNTNDAITIPEAAAQIGVTVMTIYRWVKRGRLIAIKLGAHTLIPISEVQRIKTQRQTS